MPEHLSTFRKRLDEILEGSEELKPTRISSFMTDMESVYKIPFLNDEKFNKNNPEVISLYREASFARVFE